MFPEQRGPGLRPRPSAWLSTGLAAASLAIAPAHALLLGGVEVPKEKVVVYLLIGHSNMAGIDAARSDGTAHPRGWNYQWSSSKTWVPAKETPGAMRNGLSTRGSGGAAMPFLKGMAAAFPEYHIGVVTNASLSATCRGENPGNNGSDMDPEDNRYWKGARLYTELIQAAKAVQSQVTLGGILCMLGSVEATRLPDTVCGTFAADIARLVSDMRADLGQPNLPFLMGEYEAGATGRFAPNLPMPALIAEQTRLIPSKLPFSATVDSRGIEMADDHHYTAVKGQGEWARRAVAILKDRSWFPTPTGMSLAPRRAGASASHRPTLVYLASLGLRAVSAGGNREETLLLIDGRTIQPERNHVRIQP